MKSNNRLLVCITLSFAGIVMLGSCAQLPTDQSYASSSTQTFSFRINTSMPEYRCIATFSETEHRQTKQIAIRDTDTGALVQTIVPPDNEVFTKSAIYFKDVTFSGDLALVIPLERSAHAVTFAAYVWDAGQKQFVEVPSFQNIRNPAIDPDTARILSHNSAGQITSYTIYAFDGQQFAPTNSLTWQPADIESDPISNAENLVHVVERKGTETVQDFLVPSEGSYDIDQNDLRIKPYYVSGSFWDLNSSKWQSTFSNEVKY